MGNHLAEQVTRICLLSPCHVDLYTIFLELQALYPREELHFSGRKRKGFKQWDNRWNVEVTRDLNDLEGS